MKTNKGDLGGEKLLGFGGLRDEHCDDPKIKFPF